MICSGRDVQFTLHLSDLMLDLNLKRTYKLFDEAKIYTVCLDVPIQTSRCVMTNFLT